MKTTVKVDEIPGARYGLGLIDRKLGCGVHVWGHDGGIHGSTSSAVTTADGRHSLAFNFNGDWSGDSDAVIEGSSAASRPLNGLLEAGHRGLHSPSPSTRSGSNMTITAAIRRTVRGPASMASRNDIRSADDWESVACPLTCTETAAIPV